MLNNCIQCLCNQIKKLSYIVYNLQKNITTVKVNSTITLPVGSNATVNNIGTDTDVKLDFGIPQGAQGISGFDGISPTIGINGNWFIGQTDTGVKAIGSSATVNVGVTTTLSSGLPAVVTNTGTSSNAIFNFSIPKGDSCNSTSLLSVEMFGILFNDINNFAIIPSGGKITWKSIKDNSGLLIYDIDNTCFKFTKTGKYLCLFNIRCATNTDVANAVFSWGLYAQLIQKEMVTSASEFLTKDMKNVSGVNIFNVTNIKEEYNFINNSLITIKSQGVKSNQLFINKFAGFNEINQIDRLNIIFIRLGDTQ